MSRVEEASDVDLHPSTGDELAIREDDEYAEVDLGMVIDGVAREFDIVEREEGLRGDKNERVGCEIGVRRWSMSTRSGGG